MTTYPEERVLRPLDPVPDDVNDWPDLALREVKIFYQGKGRYADLLEASDETPLCVLGELMPLDDELEHLGKHVSALPFAQHLTRQSTHRDACIRAYQDRERHKLQLRSG
jgi:hypothetical protein